MHKKDSQLSFLNMIVGLTSLNMSTGNNTKLNFQLKDFLF